MKENKVCSISHLKGIIPYNQIGKIKEAPSGVQEQEKWTIGFFSGVELKALIEELDQVNSANLLFELWSLFFFCSNWERKLMVTLNDRLTDRPTGRIGCDLPFWRLEIRRQRLAISKHSILLYFPTTTDKISRWILVCNLWQFCFAIQLIIIIIQEINDYQLDQVNNALWLKGWHFKKSYQKMFNFENWFLCQF